MSRVRATPRPGNLRSRRTASTNPSTELMITTEAVSTIVLITACRSRVSVKTVP